MLNKLLILIFLVIPTVTFSQEEVQKDSITALERNDMALRPAKAGFYSAIVPGLGHFKNKYNYIKIPVIYGALGTTTYFFIDNNNKYQLVRQIFRDKKIDDSSYPEYTIDFLERAQKYYKKQRDLAMLLTVGTYILQVVWASVDAHLEYHNTNNDLSFAPQVIYEPITGERSFGAGLTFNF